MPRYLRAYTLRDLREFPGWNEESVSVAAPADTDGDSAPTATPGPLTDDDVVFLHEDLRVTRGVAADEQVIFDGASAAWEAFCRTHLGFAVPDWEAESQAVQAELASDARPAKG